jgi:hypothetical protein
MQREMDEGDESLWWSCSKVKEKKRTREMRIGKKRGNEKKSSGVQWQRGQGMQVVVVENCSLQENSNKLGFLML